VESPPPTRYNNDLGYEYEKYCAETPTRCEKPLEWWGACRNEYPRLSKTTFNILSIPLISAECERMFSATKRFVPSERSRLKDNIIEAMSCLRHWYKAEEAFQAEDQG
jgi:hypothetical protein